MKDSIIKCVCGGQGNIRTTRTNNGIRRNYRVCKKCGYAWSTIEISLDEWETAKKAMAMIDKVRADI